MAGRLNARVALITGAGQGIARASALIFAREGARVLIAELDEELGASTAQAILAAGGDAIFVRTDATDEASVETAFRVLDDRFGRIDILYNCVGGSRGDDADVAQLSLEVFDKTLSLDVRSAVLNSRQAIPRMAKQGGGVIINMSSYLALRAAAEVHSYIAAKGAILSLTRGMASTYSSQGIRVNAIAPGQVMTERGKLRSIKAAESEHATKWNQYRFGTGEPEDIGNIALFLASDDSRMITGQTIVADGGITSF
jgi:NAD(P)-dependent dehydrogenase (short-subunit alcohol dehydrogenase family)